MIDSAGEETAELEALRLRAETGEPAAMTALAKRLLVGQDAPFAPKEAVDLLTAAIGLGDGEAASISANLAAAGAWRPQSWPAAFDLLTLAAERGARLAQGQLQLLSAAAPADTDWRAMAARIPVDDWLRPPPRVPICEAPRIRVGKGFLPHAVCDWLMDRARNNLRPAKMLEAYGDIPRLSGERSNSDFIIDIVTADVVLTLVRARISAFMEIPTIGFQPPQILHYAVGQELKPHFDFLDRSVSEAVRAEMGNQIATVLVYLNEDYDGGETDFSRANLRHKGAKGDVVAFANVDRAGNPDRMTLHAGLPPIRGEKWLFSQWIRDQPIAASR